jgi:hypothetical protein
MKQIAKSVVKAVLVIFLFTGGTVGLSTAGMQTVNAANAASANQVYEYLVSKGYTVVTLEPKAGTKYDWIAHTIKNQVHYSTTIYCTSTSIVGNADSPM